MTYMNPDQLILYYLFRVECYLFTGSFKLQNSVPNIHACVHACMTIHHKIKKKYISECILTCTSNLTCLC